MIIISRMKINYEDVDSNKTLTLNEYFAILTAVISLCYFIFLCFYDIFLAILGFYVYPIPF
jgi:hypothetical protein